MAEPNDYEDFIKSDAPAAPAPSGGPATGLYGNPVKIGDAWYQPIEDPATGRVIGYEPVTVRPPGGGGGATPADYFTRKELIDAGGVELSPGVIEVKTSDNRVVQYRSGGRDRYSASSISKAETAGKKFSLPKTTGVESFTIKGPKRTIKGTVPYFEGAEYEFDPTSLEGTMPGAPVMPFNVGVKFPSLTGNAPYQGSFIFNPYSNPEIRGGLTGPGMGFDPSLLQAYGRSMSQNPVENAAAALALLNTRNEMLNSGLSLADANYLLGHRQLGMADLYGSKGTSTGGGSNAGYVSPFVPPPPAPEPQQPQPPPVPPEQRLTAPFPTLQADGGTNLAGAPAPIPYNQGVVHGPDGRSYSQAYAQMFGIPTTPAPRYNQGVVNAPDGQSFSMAYYDQFMKPQSQPQPSAQPSMPSYYGEVGPGGRTWGQVTGNPYLSDAERMWYLGKLGKQVPGGQPAAPTAPQTPNYSSYADFVGSRQRPASNYQGNFSPSQYFQQGPFSNTLYQAGGGMNAAGAPQLPAQAAPMAQQQQMGNGFATGNPVGMYDLDPSTFQPVSPTPRAIAGEAGPEAINVVPLGGGAPAFNPVAGRALAQMGQRPTGVPNMDQMLAAAMMNERTKLESQGVSSLLAQELVRNKAATPRGKQQLLSGAA